MWSVINVLKSTLLISFLLFAACSQAIAKQRLIENQQQFKQAVENVSAGDTLVLADGEWRDFEITLSAMGLKNAPITLTAQNKGKVIISGQSNLRLAGEYLHVSGLVFTDGYSPTGEVISFRVNEKQLASHSRITEVVIKNFSNPNKFEEDKWVVLYGKHNRIDHSHFEGKRNAGVTMAVRLNDQSSQENHHRIDHNYFGPRPILGSNGGETLRIGTSKYSLTNSFTVVEHNYFDRCNGEVEIISNKSGKNIFRNNTFFESRGTLTLRHGNGNLVENNVFFGNGKDHTGGIRVINAQQTIRNNYMQGLTGNRFGGALVVMNGVPNSTINRYHQVKDSRIENNSIIDAGQINFAAGSDKERSAVPKDSLFINNLLFNQNKVSPVAILDDVNGIDFSNNLANYALPNELRKSKVQANLILAKHENGLLYPSNASEKNIGVAKSLTVTQKNQTGAPWFAKQESTVEFASGKSHKVENVAEFYQAVAIANSGDRLILSTGEFELNRIISLDKVITIQGQGKNQSILMPKRSTLFELGQGGSLQLLDLSIDGRKAPDSAGNVLVRHTTTPVTINYRLAFERVDVSNLNVNHSYHVFKPGYHSFADSILVADSEFSNITGDVLQLDKEQDDLGIYNAEYVTIEKSQFRNIDGALVKLYRGGTDESTFGPHFVLANSKLDNIGLGKRNKSQTAIQLHGVQVSEIDSNQFNNTAVLHIDHTVGQPRTQIVDNVFVDTPQFVITELPQNQPDTAVIKGNKFL